MQHCSAKTHVLRMLELFCVLHMVAFSFLAGASTICELHYRGQVFDNLNKTSGSLN